jgi:hypothetical protein
MLATKSFRFLLEFGTFVYNKVSKGWDLRLNIKFINVSHTYTLYQYSLKVTLYSIFNNFGDETKFVYTDPLENKDALSQWPYGYL